MAASIALGCGGKALVCGSRPWRGRRQARFVTRLHFCHQQFFCSRRTEACLWHNSNMLLWSFYVGCWGQSRSGNNLKAGQRQRDHRGHIPAGYRPTCGAKRRLLNQYQFAPHAAASNQLSCAALLVRLPCLARHFGSVCKRISCCRLKTRQFGSVQISNGLGASGDHLADGGVGDTMLCPEPR
jgi:hypothetical protein